MDRHEFKKMLREARVLSDVDNATFSKMVFDVHFGFYQSELKENFIVVL